MVCSNSFCKKEFDENEAKIHYFAYNLQKKNEKIEFCSLECKKSWLIRKIITMAISLIIGFVFAFVAFGFPTGLAFVLIPYMIRQCASMLRGLFDGGTSGEFFAFAIVIFGSITIIYPLYKLIKEITYYVKAFKNLEPEVKEEN